MPRQSARSEIEKELLDITVERLRQRNRLLEDELLRTVDDDAGNDSGSESGASSSESSSSSSSDSSSDSSDSHDSSADFYDHFPNLHAIGEFLKALEATRVLYPNVPVPKLSQLSLVLFDYRDSHLERFKRNLRVSPTTFDKLCDLLRLDEVFQNRSKHPQAPVEVQLAVFLYRAGHFGNAASVESVAQWAGASVGFVVKATQRVIAAIIGLHDEAIRPATEQEKASAKAWIGSQTCWEWRHGWIMVDGTLIPLFAKPGWHGETYFDRKSNYSLNLAVCRPSYLLYLCLARKLTLLPSGIQSPQSSHR